jgi:hypothetical protein
MNKLQEKGTSVHESNVPDREGRVQSVRKYLSNDEDPQKQ